MTKHDLLIKRYHQLIGHIHSLEGKYQRPSNSIKLLAVSKSQPLNKISALLQANQLDFGENYLQEGLSKISALISLKISSPYNWHFIGQLQSNKLRAIAAHFNWVQTVTSLKQAVKLGHYRGQIDQEPPNLNICIQINISRSKTKNGVLPDIALLEDLLGSINLVSNLRLRGLMTMPDPTETIEAQSLPYCRMAELFAELQSKGLSLDTLSMGTSHDMEAAISAGSTLVRIGTALFGERE